MITIETTPGKVCFCNNPIVFGVSTNNMFSTVGVKACLVMKLIGTDQTVGHGFKLSFGNTVLEFALVASPGESGLDLLVASGEMTLQQWGALLVEGLKSNFHLVSQFNITGSFHATYYLITIEALSASSGCTITLDDITISTLSEQSNTSGVTPVIRENFKIIGRLYLVDGSERTLLAEEQITPDSSGKARFDFSQYLLSEVDRTPQFLFPQNLADFIIDRSSQILRYAVQFGEYYAGQYYRLYDTIEDETYVMAGGIDFAQMAKYTGEDSSFFEMLPYNKDFLSWRPPAKKIWIRQPEMLHFLVWYSNPTWLALTIRITYTDGSTHAFTKQTISPITPFGVYEICCTYAKLDLVSLPQSQGKTIHKYELWLEDNGVQVSRTMEFILDRMVYPNQRFFIFRNSLGGFDSVRCTGVTVKETDLERFTVENINSDFSVLDPPKQQLFARETQKYKANTGFITKLESEYLRDFFLSNEIYEFIENRLYPVMILSTSLQVHKDNEFLHFRDFEYARAYEDVNYAHDENIFLSKNFNKSFNTSYL